MAKNVNEKICCNKMTRYNKIMLTVMVVCFLSAVLLTFVSPPMQRTASNEANQFCDPSNLPSGWRLCYWVLLSFHFISYLLCSFKWIYCSLSQQKIRPIRYNEVWLLLMRWLHFIYAMFLVGLILIGRYTISAAVLFPLAVLLWFSFFHALSRTTFRPIPCYLLSFSAVILFVCFSGLPYQSDNMWGLSHFAKDVFRFIDNIFNSDSDTFKTLFASSAIIAVLASTVLAAGKRMINKYLSQATEDNTTKTTRRQILSHWWYNPKAVLIENSNICVAVGFVAACSVILIASSNKAIDDKNGGYSLLFFAAIASVFAIIGIFGLFTVRDNDLLKSEYYFLHYTALQIGQFRLGEDDNTKSSVEERLTAEIEDLTLLDQIHIIYDKLKLYLNRRKFTAHLTRGMFGCVNQDKAERRIRDFCQVSVHLLVNGSTIRSENEVAHNIFFLFENIGEVVRCKQTHGILVSELFNAYRDERTRLANSTASVLQSSSKKLSTVKDGSEQGGTNKKNTQEEKSLSKFDLLFSSILLPLINSSHARKCPPIKNISSCVQTIQSILTLPDVSFYFFTENVSANELITLLQFDSLNQVARMYISDGCIASWQCEKDCSACKYGHEKREESLSKITTVHNMWLTVLLYPLLILQSMSERCQNIIEGEGSYQKTYRLEKLKDMITMYYDTVINDTEEDCPAKAHSAFNIPQEKEADYAYQLFQKFYEVYMNLPHVFQEIVSVGITQVGTNYHHSGEASERIKKGLSSRVKVEEIEQPFEESICVLLLMVLGYPLSKKIISKDANDPPDLIMPVIP